MYENKHKKVVENIYNNYVEDTRLTRTRKGQLEYFTTMTYIHKYLKKGMRILEVGAATGRYSIQLAKEGYKVNAIELVEHNLEVLKANARGVKNIVAEQGDALDLTRFDDDTFDMVLVLGPMYHLYSKKDQIQAVNEAIRVCKPNGIIMFAYLTDGSIVFDWGTEGNMKEIKKQLNPDFSVKQRPQDLFISFTIYNFEKLLIKTGTTKLHQVATDGIIPICENNPNFKMDDEDFEILKQYHLATCERIDMQGLSGHMLYICRKD